MITAFLPRRLSSRIIVSFVLLLVAVQATAFFLVNAANSANARSKIASELAVAERIVERLLANHRERLLQAASIMSADFALREAVATRDLETIDSALRNHGTRIGASLTMLVDLESSVLVDSSGLLQGQRFPFAALIERAHEKLSATQLVLLGPRAYQLIVVPVMAPIPVGWIAVGFEIDDALANDLRRLTELQVSFFVLDPARAAQPLASTLPAPERDALVRALAANSGSEPSAAISRYFKQRGQEGRLLLIGTQQNQQVVAVLQRSLEEALASFGRLRIFLVLLAMISLPIAALASWAIARGITKPLLRLTSSAARMRAGDFSEPIAGGDVDEVGVLAGSLNHMREAIAEREAHILRLAYEDSLTGLPNRARLTEALEQALHDSNDPHNDQQSTEGPRKQGAVMLLDLDRFKGINDTLGHAAGDEVLRQVASRIGAVLSSEATLARLGGDEFAVVLPHATEESARQVARHISTALLTPIEFNGQPLDVGASIGIALFPTDGRDGGTLLRHADVAMYAAKRNHGGHAFYEPRHNVLQREHLSLLGELRRAVEQSELRACYQPKIDLASNCISGVEALVRWRHPTRGIVSPQEFMPYAEQTGFVRVITRWMLAVTLRQCGVWSAAGVPLCVAVNISTRDLLSGDLPQVVGDLLKTHAIPPAQVALEITESSFMQDPDRALATLQSLNALGVKLAIDDFGTGFSSLTYLKKLPVHELKIDRSFVQGMENDRDDFMIVRSTIELAHNLGLRVVAEGVETERCLAQLRELGCDAIQGYLISAAMRRRQLDKWLQESPWAAQLFTPAAVTQ